MAISGIVVTGPNVESLIIVVRLGKRVLRGS